MGLRFIHAAAQKPAKADFDALLASGTDGVRLAMCFFLKAGFEILRPHAKALSHPESFAVASLDFPTNLDALAKLHQLAPGHVYIHLGWVTPEEKKGSGPALMHSKLCLAREADTRRLWVGSHNLTASAMGGANIEAALLYEATNEDSVIADAEKHLSDCRDTAELFDPSRLDEYKELQARKAGLVGIRDQVVVLHAEEQAPLKQMPAVIHVRLPTVKFDSLTRTGTTVHLFVHPIGSLRTASVITPAVRRFTGKIIEDNRTEHHPEGGSASTMRQATHWLDFARVPILITPNTSKLTPVTQAAILIEREETQAGAFLYSLTKGSSRGEASSTPDRVRRDAAPDELLQFFTSRSLEGESLIFAPREHLRATASVKVYDATPIPERFVRNVDRTKERQGERPLASERQSRRRFELDVTKEKPQHELDAYFFRSSFRVASDDTDVD